jgi:hypothetical protein
LDTLDAFLTRDEAFVVELSGGDQVQITVVPAARWSGHDERLALDRWRYRLTARVL